VLFGDFTVSPLPAFPKLFQSLTLILVPFGTAPGFIPDTLDTSIYDEIIPITTEEAYGTTRPLARHEGILAGISCGAAVAGMLKLARRENWRHKVLLAILPDTGERYISTELWSESDGG